MSLPPEFAARLEEKRQAVQEATRALDSARRAVVTRQERLAQSQLELRTFEEAAALIEPSFAKTIAAAPGVAPGEAALSGTRQRSLTDPWKAILREMASLYPAEVSLEDVGKWCAKYGVSDNADTVRGNMHEHKKRGLVESGGGRGRFRITKAGATMAGADLTGSIFGEEDLSWFPDKEEAADDLSSAASGS